MRIGIDVQTLETPERDRGIGRLCERTIGLLAGFVPEHELLLFGMGADAPQGVNGLLGPRVRYVPAGIGDPGLHLHRGCAAPFLWDTPEGRSLDVYHVTSPMMPDILQASWGPCPIVATLLDAIPAAMHERGTPLFDDAGWARYRMRANVLRTYQHYVPISASAADDCARFLDLDRRKMTVTHVPINPLPEVKVDAQSAAAVLERFGLSPGYCVCVSGYHPRKNIAGTIRAYAGLPAELRARCPLVLICALTDAERAEVAGLAAEAGVGANVCLTGFVTDAELVALVRAAGVFVFLSLYEGFGIPVAEAMACAVPVVSADNSSLPEIVGDAGILVDAADEAACARAIARILEQPQLARRFRAAGAERVRRFSPENYIDRLLDAYGRAVEQQAKSAVAVSVGPPRPLNVAVFGPLGPRMSGIAEYNEQMLLHLDPDIHADCFIEDYVPNHHLVRERIGCFEYTAFASRHAERPYDAMLYHLGNNTMHGYALPFAERYPGVLVLHDLSLLGVNRHLAFAHGAHASVVERFLRDHPEADTEAWVDDVRAGELDPWEHSMTRSLLSDSRCVVVHSEWLAEHVRAKSGEDVPVRVFPMGVSFAWVNAPRPPREALRRKYLVPRDAFVIVSIGVVNRLKRIPEVLEAFAAFHSQCPNSQFLLLGPSDPALMRSLNEYCATRRLKHCVRFLGHRDLYELFEVVDLADVCVNLRFPSMGETSATLMVCLAMGKPVLVTPVRQFLEFPDSVCWKVNPGAREKAELIEYFRYLWKHPEAGRRLGEHAREFATDGAWANLGGKYSAVLREAAAAHMLA